MAIETRNIYKYEFASGKSVLGYLNPNFYSKNSTAVEI